MKQYLTIEMLIKRGICASQLDLFRKTFGNKIELNPENYEKAEIAGLNVWYLEGDIYKSVCEPKKAKVKKNLNKDYHISGINDEMLTFEGREVTLVNNIGNESPPYKNSFRILEDMERYAWNSTMFVNGKKLKPLKIIKIELCK